VELDKATLNASQGEFGLALAETKLEDIKVIFAQIQNNMANESQFIDDSAKEMAQLGEEDIKKDVTYSKQKQAL
tara:strand:- start:433 stop:654 length:222 start_codon:yes stop_codon:yes gene_type:complete